MSTKKDYFKRSRQSVADRPTEPLEAHVDGEAKDPDQTQFKS